MRSTTRLILEAVALVGLAALAGCDPSDRIALTVPAPAGDDVVVYWLHFERGQTVWDELADRGRASDAGLGVTSQVCCGTARRFRAGRLWFFACADGPDGQAIVRCGKVGAPSTHVWHPTTSGETCAAIERALDRACLDPETCALDLARAPRRRARATKFERRRPG